ncbi:hypothetical protein GUJ93_ZPchr0013g37637 [Zizania palustris]|uniref:Uncharacterized protein n=1 Tax=Zizania palustris TaxID=103762 RepID=A0A8J5WUI2_ZIZPA|nr:hypothetical protein GUJ93_ZPchr0013g37637 [Zizania palustris]
MEENEPGQQQQSCVILSNCRVVPLGSSALPVPVPVHQAVTIYHGIGVRQVSSFLLHSKPAMAKVAPSLLSVGAAAFAAGSLRNRAIIRRPRISAKLGGDGELKPAAGKKKFITREEEPEQYWQTAGERKGENPMMTPLPYIIIFGMSTPFVILAIAFANGWIKVPIR